MPLGASIALISTDCPVWSMAPTGVPSGLAPLACWAAIGVSSGWSTVASKVCAGAGVVAGGGAVVVAGGAVVVAGAVVMGVVVVPGGMVPPLAP